MFGVVAGAKIFIVDKSHTYTACTIWDRSLVSPVHHFFVGKQTEGKKRHVNEFCIVGVYIEETGISRKSDANLNVISVFFLSRGTISRTM